MGHPLPLFQARHLEWLFGEDMDSFNISLPFDWPLELAMANVVVTASSDAFCLFHCDPFHVLPLDVDC